LSKFEIRISKFETHPQVVLSAAKEPMSSFSRFAPSG